MIRIAAATLILFAALFAALAMDGGAAEAKCYPARNNDGRNYWTGEYQYVGYPTGISSYLKNYDPYVVRSPHPVQGTYWGQISTAWVMLANGSGWAQAGWIEYTMDYRYTFYQYTLANGDIYHRNSDDLQNPYPEGQQTVYQVNREDVIPGYWTFRAGPPRLDGRPALAIGYGNIYFSPDHGEISGEITSLANQMPGGYYYYSQQWFQATYIRSYSTWYAFNGITVNSNPVHFSHIDMPPHYQYGGGAFAIWDNACYS